MAKQNHWPELDPKEKPTPQMICCKLEFDILYQANLVSVVCTFGTSKCRICAREKLDIFKHSFNPLVKLMNNCLEIYGACKHKPKFHRYKSTDESTDKKVLILVSNHTSVQCNIACRIHNKSYFNRNVDMFCKPLNNLLMKDTSIIWF